MHRDAQNPASALPTLEDVAARSGVSTATVSRCLNEPRRVSDATRKRVLDAVRELGYAPNFGARALAAKRTNTFGAIIPTMENAIFARGLQAFQEELGANGVSLLVASSSYSPELEEEQIRNLVARGADALLLIGHDRARPSLSIGFDNRAAMKALALEVIGLGHRKLGFITAERRSNDRARERWEGVRDAMRETGLDPADLAVFETTYAIARGSEAFISLMKHQPRPTAVLAGNDVLAAGALLAAKELGLDVPGDVSVTGFDDIEIAEIVTPGITTVHVPHRMMGRGAARLLLGLVGGEPAGESIALEPHIAMRGSLGPAPPVSAQS